MGVAWLLMGLSPLAVAAWLLAKHGFRVEPGPPRTLASATLAWAWVTLGVEILGTLGRLDPVWLVAWSVGALVAAGLVAWLRPWADAPSQPLGSDQIRLGPAAIFASGLLLWVLLRMGLISFIHPVKVVSDGPIYHLYMAARWWKAGRVFPVPTPFGELGATYFWANGEAWYAWLMTLFGGDRFAKVGQVPFFLLLGPAVETLARQLRVGASAARLAAVWLLTVSPLILFAVEPNVDAILVAGYVAAITFFVRAFRAVGGVARGDLILGSLAAGLGMGTKPTGIVFFPPVLVGVLVLIAWRERRSLGRCFATFGLAIVPAVATMIYWPARNAWLTGNPLYPLHVEMFGRVWLAGWFGPGAMTFSPFYVPLANWRALVDIVMQVLDPREFPVWLAAAVGLWALGRPRRADPLDDRPEVDRWVWAITALAAFDLAAYWLVIPYRTQQRFSLPAVALFSVALAKLFDRGSWARGIALGVLVLHVLTPQPWPIASKESDIPWDMLPYIPNILPALIFIPTSLTEWRLVIGQPKLWATILLGVGAFGAVWFWNRPLRVSAGKRAWTTRLLALAWLAPFLAAGAWCLGAAYPMRFPVFEDFNAGWADLELRTGRDGARIAYAGNKIPYYLMGSRLENDVRYVNIDAHRDWLLHDYHRAASSGGKPATWPDPFPMWDRLRPDYDAWLANLRAENVDLLVVTRVNTDDGSQYAADRDRYPIERVWADAHPRVFRPIFGPAIGDPKIRIYQILPP